MHAWGEAEKMPIERAFEIGILSVGELFLDASQT